MIKRIITATIILSLLFIFGGSHAIKAFASMESWIPESGEDNNEKIVASSSSSLPDLVIESITWSPEPPSKGDSVAFSVTIKNQGDAQASSSRVDFYIDGASRGYQEVLRIEDGKTATKTFTWTAQEGSHTIKAIIDEDNWVPESDEDNNEKTITFQTAPPDLIIENITWSPSNPSQSDNVTFTVFIKNQGSGRADYSRVDYYIDDTYLASDSVDPIDAGATDNRTFSWIAHSDSRVIKAVADANEKVTESDETNNEKSVTLPTILPDLIVQDITWSPTSPSVGETVTFTVTIKNQGNANAHSSRVYLYVDGSSRGYKTILRIEDGETATKTFTWKAQEGSHTIKAVADKESEVSESNEDNNEKTATFSGASFPDLIIEAITWTPEEPPAGEEVTFTVFIKNQGSRTADYSRVAYYIDGTRLDSSYVDPIAAGATDNRTFTWTVQEGSYAIKAVADANVEVLESDEGNNEKTITFPPPPPDLIIEAITWSPKNPSESDNVTFTITVKNQGGKKADSSSVAYYIDDTYLTSASVNPIDPEATNSQTFSWIAQTGSHIIQAIADADEQVIEGDETNNEKTVTLPTIAPDFIIEAITWSPKDPSESDNVTFTITVKNQGSSRAGSFRVYFYVDGSSQGYQEVPQIDVDDTATKTFIWAAQEGSHTIRAVADKEDEILECDEDNNGKTASLSVSPPPPPAPAPATKPPEAQAKKTTPPPRQEIWPYLLLIVGVLAAGGTLILFILRSLKR